jgi:class 3 adenylate cyclase/tetratricopeptide (TPR) repeat protein
LQSKSALEGERKQVTVMFADVKGSMELAEQLGPEDWHGILERFFAILAEGVHRFEGTVNQYTGDGIMALFGAPIAHEDHAQRACYAALYLRDTLRAYADELRRTQGISLSTRIGINSGEVVVGKIGDDLRMDYTAQGHTVGLAQRMEQTAAADSTHLTAHTARLVEGYFQLRDLGDFELKGVGEPLRVHALEGVGALRTRLDSSRSRGFSTFVGREREMASLDAALEAAIAGSGHVVGVVADAGTGKSRLCHEFVERCRARGIRVNEAHCPAHGKTIPYLPLLEMLRDIFGIDARDSDHEARRKIAGELMLLDETFQTLLPILFEFMGVADPAKPAPAMSPEGRQQKLFAFVRHLVQARSEREPSVLFVDDLHWIDPGSDAFLAHSVEAAAQTRTLWLVNFRPEYQAEWMGKSFYQQLPLRPLASSEIAALLVELLGNDPSVAVLPARIQARTGGNPFFIEEIVQALVENGSLEGVKGGYRLVTADDALELPATVQSVLAARLDRLPEREKRLLQTASVIGKEYSGALLERVVAASGRHAIAAAELSEALAALARAEFIFEAALYPEVEYAFKHPLTQEVAYTSQLATRRAELHAAVARAIEDLRADKLDERAALLAYHWEQAGEAMTSAQWYARAAGVAGRDSPAEAMRHWDRVRALLAPLDPTDAAVDLRLQAASQLLVYGLRQGMSRERMDQIFTEGRALAASRGSVREQVRLLYGIAINYLNLGELRRSISYCEESLALADASGEPELRWVTREILEFVRMLVGELDAALRVSDEQMELIQPDPLIGLGMVGISGANSCSHRMMILIDLGRFDEAEDANRRFAAMAHRSNESELICWNDCFHSRLYVRRGEVQSALSIARRAIESAERSGSLLSRVGSHGHYGIALAENGEWKAAILSLDLALELTRANAVGHFWESDFVAAQAEAHLGLSDGPRARELAVSAIEIARRMEMRVAEARGLLALSRVLLTLDGATAREEIESALDVAEALVRSTGARVYAPQIHVERARLAGALSDPASREQHLREAHRLFTELGATGHADRVASLLAEVGASQ